MRPTPQSQAADLLSQVLANDARVRGLVLTGSLAHPDVVLDQWSDVDLVVVVADGGTAEFHPATQWLGRRGPVYAADVSQHGYVGVTRAFFADGLRVDVVVAPESACAEGDTWPLAAVHYGARCLFSRSAALDALLAAAAAPSPAPPVDTEDLGRGFRFKAMLAASKVARGDLLVALHLTLDLVRDCTVLAMLRRDRELGTDHHRQGNPHDPLLAALPSPPVSYEAGTILDCIVASAQAFGNLSLQPRCDGSDDGPLLDFVARVRQSVAERPDEVE